MWVEFYNTTPTTLVFLEAIMSLCIALAIDGSHLSPLIFLSFATLSSSFLALAFASKDLASNLDSDLWTAVSSAAITSQPSTTAEQSLRLNCKTRKGLTATQITQILHASVTCEKKKS